MKILILNDCGMSAHYWERVGIAKVLNYCGHGCRIWDPKINSTFDIFDTFEPDIFIGQTYNIDTALIKCLEERPWVKILLKASDYGYINNHTTLDSPIVRASDKEVALLNKLRMVNNNIVLFIHYHPDYLNFTHNLWGAEGYKVISLMNAADVFSFHEAGDSKEYQCDLSFVGGYWKYKSITINKYILPLCSDLSYKIKIFGNSHWPVIQYLGQIQTEHIKYLFSSSKICLNVHELHSQQFGYDVVERPFKILSCGGFCISDYVEGLDKILGDGLVFGENPSDYKDKINYYLANRAERQVISKIGQKLVLRDHTYFNRVSTIFNVCGEADLADDVLNKRFFIKGE